MVLILFMRMTDPAISSSESLALAVDLGEGAAPSAEVDIEKLLVM